MIGTLVLMLGACAAAPVEECRTVQCELELAAADLANTCSSHLFIYPVSKRDFIDREYGYPFTNYDTYTAMLKLGARVTSPREWCDHYAAFKTRVVFPGSSS